jgi:acyl-CoA thioesterase I
MTHRITLAFAACAFCLSTPAPAQTPVVATVPPSAATAQPKADSCGAPSDVLRLDYVLARTARRLAGGEPIKIVAIGSSSTAGAGASSPAASYPSQLEIELARRFPGRGVSVLNRGNNGESATDMLARFDAEVIAEKPDLVLWQVGTNSVLRDRPLEPHTALIHEGLLRLKAAGADVVLIDPQFAPKVNAKPEAEGMVKLISQAAKLDNVSLFSRYKLMRHWHEVRQLPFEAFLSPDELHMNDWSYACVAKLLAGAITEAATRPTASAAAHPAR